jgi:hypothetical protein
MSSFRPRLYDEARWIPAAGIRGRILPHGQNILLGKSSNFSGRSDLNKRLSGGIKLQAAK